VICNDAACPQTLAPCGFGENGRLDHPDTLGIATAMPCVIVASQSIPFSTRTRKPILIRRILKLHKGEQNGPEYLAINPRGQVPVLVVDDIVISQIVAICEYLHMTFPEMGFFPKSAIEKAKVLQTFAWMNNSVHTTFMHVFMPGKFSGDQAAQAAIKVHAQGQYETLLKELQAMVIGLEDKHWLSGENFGALDAYAITLLRWGGMAGIDPLSLPQLWAYVQKVALHAPVATVIERERIQLDVFKRV
jgi:glutathione S-transferase